MKHKAIGMILAVLGVACAWGSGGAEAGAAPATGTISYLDGDVTLDGNEASIGDAVRRGATLQTGPASVCEISWGNENIIQLQENTLATLNVGSGAPGVKLASGSMAAVLNRVEAMSKKGTLQVQTPSATAGVRGTVFFVKVEDASNTYICACYGSLGIASAPDGELASTKHVARRFTGSRLSARSTAAGLLYHDSQSIGDLAAKVGYVIPWGQGTYGSSGSKGGGY